MACESFSFFSKKYLIFLLPLSYFCAAFSCQEKIYTIHDLPWNILWRIGRYVSDNQKNKDLNAVKSTCKDLNLRMQDARMYWRMENGNFWTPDTHEKKTKGPAVFTARRKQLINLVKQHYSQGGAILLAAGINQSLDRFIQESTFHYYTGMNASGIVLLIDLDHDKTMLFTPQFSLDVDQWEINPIAEVHRQPAIFGIDEFVKLGSSAGLTDVSPYSPDNAYHNLISYISQIIQRDGHIFTFGLQQDKLQPRFLVERIMRMTAQIIKTDCNNKFVCIDDIVTTMRRKKDIAEIKTLFKALQITHNAYAQVAPKIKSRRKEIDVKSKLEKKFRLYGCPTAYGSIVRSGEEAKIIHDFEDDINKRLTAGELLLIDAAAMYCHECCDITRVFPISGHFTSRQKELLNHVIETQHMIARVAKPGSYLIHKDDSQYMRNASLDNGQNFVVSLRSLAQMALLKATNQKMPHGVSHHIGLDTHDICPLSAPLQVGDVFTIEPGIYEELGLRHEDDYLMTPQGAMKLSEMFPSTAEGIEQMMIKK